MIRIKNILLPTDFSRFSLAAAPYAIELAEKYNAAVHLIHVEEDTPPIVSTHSMELSEESVEQSLDSEAFRGLKLAAAEIQKTGFNNLVPILKKGVEYEEIVSYCAEAAIDMVVIASHGRTGLLHTLLGSVADKVIRNCKCPVLVITPESAE